MSSTVTLPTTAEMYRAITRRDPAYEGVFVTAVKTTGIFCRPTCAARTPKRENVEFFPGPAEARAAGYRACKRCRPEEPRGEAPEWIRPLLEALDEEPARRWTDADLLALELSPERVRRWFKEHRGSTFHGWQRGRRLGLALTELNAGADIAATAFDYGFESLSGFADALSAMAGAPPGRARRARPVVLERFVSPLGPMVAGATADAVCLLEFADRKALASELSLLGRELGPLAPGTNALIARLRAELDEYFAGSRREFTVPLATPGTPFQQEAWRALREIPHGATRSYAEQAAAIGRPSAVRAIARANGANRIAILVPCHRVVGSDGKLTGYGGGLWRKQHLLDLERGNRGLFAKIGG